MNLIMSSFKKMAEKKCKNAWKMTNDMETKQNKQ